MYQFKVPFLDTLRQVDNGGKCNCVDNSVAVRGKTVLVGGKENSRLPCIDTDIRNLKLAFVAGPVFRPYTVGIFSVGDNISRFIGPFPDQGFRCSMPAFFKDRFFFAVEYSRVPKLFVTPLMLDCNGVFQPVTVGRKQQVVRRRVNVRKLGVYRKTAGLCFRYVPFRVFYPEFRVIVTVVNGGPVIAEAVPADGTRYDTEAGKGLNGRLFFIENFHTVVLYTFPLLYFRDQFETVFYAVTVR